MSRILIFIGLFLLGCDSRETQLQRFLIQGNKALAEQDFAGAEYYFQESVRLEPCFTDALNNLGVLNSEQKHFDVAINYFNKTLECNADFLPAYFNRANAFYESKEYYNLLKDAEYILKIKPDTAVGYVLKGLALTRLRQLDKALEAFTKAIAQEPNNPEHWVNLGTVKYYQKNWSGAEADFKRALQLQKDQANALNAIGLIKSDKNLYDSAIFYFDKALALTPNQPYFLNNKGFIFIQQSKLEQAAELINLSITLDPDNAWAYRNKGIYYLQKEDYQNAVRLLKQSLQMDETVDRIHLYLGMAFLKNGDVANGCKQLTQSQENKEGEITKDLLKACR